MVWRRLNRVREKSGRFDHFEQFWSFLTKLNKSGPFWTKVDRSARRDSCHNSRHVCHSLRACDRSCHFTSSCLDDRAPSPSIMMNWSEVNGTERNEKVCVARVHMHANDMSWSRNTRKVRRTHFSHFWSFWSLLHVLIKSATTILCTKWKKLIKVKK